MSRLLAFLRQPYPVLDPPGPQLRRATLIGLFVASFLLAFQPFGLREWVTPHKTLKIAGFGVVSWLVTLTHFTVWPALWPGAFRERSWTIGRAALFLNLNIGLVALGNLLYLRALLPVPLTVTSLAAMTVATILVGVFPVAGTTLATYIRQLRHHQRTAAALPALRADAPASVAAPPAVELPRALTFTADNGKDTLTLPATELLYGESADNYCTLVHQRPNQPPTRTLLRAALSRLAAQAATQHAVPGAARLVRVHRSYLVNLDRVTRVSGNAQGYRLHFGGAAADLEPVPVGRTYADNVLAALRAPAVHP